MGNIGGANPEIAVPILGEALRHRDVVIRRRAAGALKSFGPKAVLALKELVAALGDADREIRRSSAIDLNGIGREAGPAIPALLLCLGRPDNDSATRINVTAALANLIGPGDKSAVGELSQAAKDANPEVCLNAAIALANIDGGKHEIAVPVLRESLRHSDAAIRRRAVAALKSFGPKAAAAVPALVRLLGELKEQPEIRIKAALALENVGKVPATIKVVPTLVRVVGDKADNGSVRERALWALRVHEGDFENLSEVIPTLVTVLSEPKTAGNRKFRQNVACTLAWCKGPEAPAQVLDVLSDCLKQPGRATDAAAGRDDDRLAIVHALTQVGPTKITKRSAIFQTLQAIVAEPISEESLREAAGKLLSKIARADPRLPVPSGSDVTAALAKVKEVYKDSYTQSRPAQKQSLAKRLLKEGLATKEGPALQFTFIREARDLAADAGDPNLVVQAVDELSKRFAVNGIEAKAGALERARRAPGRVAPPHELAETALALVDPAIATDEYVIAERLLLVAVAEAKNGPATRLNPSPGRSSPKFVS
jgi:HEAT repeat protein